MRKMKSLVYGTGDKGFKYPVAINRVHLKEYSLWVGMLKRCNRLCQEKFPSYIGVTCSENFKSYSYFYEWCQTQIGFKNVDEKGKVFQLDKDLLVKGNKVYSEDVCVFVPQAINKLLTKVDTKRGNYLVGVSFEESSGKFQANCTCRYGNRKIGRFITEMEAFLAYKTRKESIIKRLANEYRTQLDQRAYNALLNYEVDIND